MGLQHGYLANMINTDRAEADKKAVNHEQSQRAELKSYTASSDLLCIIYTGAHAGSSTEASTALQADINQQADEYEAVLRRSRAKMEAASRELRDWELQTARARNEGTFFKGLFKADVLQPPSEESRAAREQEPAPEVRGI